MNLANILIHDAILEQVSRIVFFSAAIVKHIGAPWWRLSALCARLDGADSIAGQQPDLRASVSEPWHTARMWCLCDATSAYVGGPSEVDDARQYASPCGAGNMPQNRVC